jgi:two-component system, response regulator
LNDQTILVVDDNSLNIEAFKTALRMNGRASEVAVVHDGQEALDWLFGENGYTGRDTGVSPRLIMLDLSMPGMGGLPCLVRIRADQRTELLPVVIFSNSGFPQDKIDAYRAGANGYVDKMSTAVPFPEMVKRVADYWLEVNQTAPI